MTAGVLISQLIAPGHKLRFVFGLADLDDSGSPEQIFVFCLSFIWGAFEVFVLGWFWEFEGFRVWSWADSALFLGGLEALSCLF